MTTNLRLRLLIQALASTIGFSASAWIIVFISDSKDGVAVVGSVAFMSLGVASTLLAVLMLSSWARVILWSIYGAGPPQKMGRMAGEEQMTPNQYLRNLATAVATTIAIGAGLGAVSLFYGRDSIGIKLISILIILALLVDSMFVGLSWERAFHFAKIPRDDSGPRRKMGRMAGKAFLLGLGGPLLQKGRPIKCMTAEAQGKPCGCGHIYCKGGQS